MGTTSLKRKHIRLVIVLIALISVLTLNKSTDLLNISPWWQNARSLSVENQLENGSRNVALGKPSRHSSNFNRWAIASKAVDGEINANWYHGGVSATRRSTDPWWEVDLQGTYLINLIRIYNRGDCCHFNLDNFHLSVLLNGDIVWSYSHPGKADTIIPLVLPDVEGTQVRIELPGKRKQLALTEVQVFSITPENNNYIVVRNSDNDGNNVALKKPTSQSSNFHKRALSANAVDGNTDGNWRNGSVSATKKSFNPWWEVDLLGSYVINRIKIYNRNDCCGFHLQSFILKIFLMNDNVWTYIHHGAVDDDISIDIPDVQGNKVKIELHGDRRQLALAEVQVFSDTPAEEISGTNVALGKPASQSSDFHSKANASRAVDGSTTGSWRSKGISTTTRSSNPWWEVDLQDSFMIKLIRIYNRSDCCSFNLDGFNLIIQLDGENVWNYSHAGTADINLISINVLPHTVGDKVRIELPGDKRTLSITEVEVISTTPKRTNLALGKPSSQSSNFRHYTISSKAVDGSIDGNWYNKAVTSTLRSKDPWWEVDLQGSFVIDLVRIYNRSDCCGQKLHRFQIFLLKNDDTVWSYSHKGVTRPIISIAVPDVEAEKVRIMLPGKKRQLVLAEVEVYGGTTNIY